MKGRNGVTSFYWTAEGIAHILSFFLPVLSSMQKWAEKNNQDSIHEHLQDIIRDVESLSEGLSKLKGGEGDG